MDLGWKWARGKGKVDDEAEREERKQGSRERLKCNPIQG